jgi:hypothetical protein
VRTAHRQGCLGRTRIVARPVQRPRWRPMSLPPEARSWERIPSLGKDMGQKAWPADL